MRKILSNSKLAIYIFLAIIFLGCSKDKEDTIDFVPENSLFIFQTNNLYYIIDKLQKSDFWEDAKKNNLEFDDIKFH